MIFFFSFIVFTFFSCQKYSYSNPPLRSLHLYYNYTTRTDLIIYYYIIIYIVCNCRWQTRFRFFYFFFFNKIACSGQNAFRFYSIALGIRFILFTCRGNNVLLRAAALRRTFYLLRANAFSLRQTDFYF